MIIRVRFALEEILLRIRDHYGEEQACSLKLCRTFRNLSIEVPVDSGWILKAILMTSVIAIAMPPIPGAFLTCFGILPTQLSIPSEGVVVMGILSTFIDMFCTALTNSYIMLELMEQAKHLGILDEETLRR